MGIRVDNTTDLSQPDEKGENYAANFEFYPFHEGGTYSLYKGVLNGDRFRYDRHGQRCVVRAFRNKITYNKTEWGKYLQIASKADEMAAQFHKEIGNMILSFPRPLLTSVDQKSSFVGIFRILNPHEKRIKSDETVVIEPYLERPFCRFDNLYVSKQSQTKLAAQPCSGKRRGSKKSGRNNSRSSESTQNQEDESLSKEMLLALDAFSHFTWHASKKFVITDLQGTFHPETNLFTLINPTIHSVDQSFGEGDKGQMGVQDFFDNHECHKGWCSTWYRYETPDGNDMIVYNTSKCFNMIMTTVISCSMQKYIHTYYRDVFEDFSLIVFIIQRLLSQPASQQTYQSFRHKKCNPLEMFSILMHLT
ncbi:hypothetical protein Btru_067924 [Bulinus truncatus]|nr:hypothetical protein Btru_067924 [Bulinus truncatus]